MLKLGRGRGRGRGWACRSRAKNCRYCQALLVEGMARNERPHPRYGGKRAKPLLQKVTQIFSPETFWEGTKKLYNGGSGKRLSPRNY